MNSLNVEINDLKGRMRGIFDLTPVAIWITEDERIVFANHACETLFGATSRESLAGQSIYPLLHPESHESVRQKMKEALDSNVAAEKVREKIARLDGGTSLVEIALAPLARDGKTALQMVITDVTESARVAGELERSRTQLRRLAANLVTTREEERLRIARELHDELGQHLTALQMELSSLAPMQSAAGAARMENLLAMVARTVASVRRIAKELRPLMLDDLGLGAAIETLVRDSRRRMGITIALAMDPVDEFVPDVAAIALYRMVQEALTNVARHAHATRVRIDIRRRGGNLVLVVQDNGVGVPEGSIYRPDAHGLIGIDERATMLGGRLEVGTAAGVGARLTVTLPLAAAPLTAVRAEKPAGNP